MKNNIPSLIECGWMLINMGIYLMDGQVELEDNVSFLCSLQSCIERH